jgi:hypothetical protein
MVGVPTNLGPRGCDDKLGGSNNPGLDEPTLGTASGRMGRNRFLPVLVPSVFQDGFEELVLRLSAVLDIS